MTRLESSPGSDAPAGFGTLFSTVAALTSPVRGMPGRPLYGDLPPLDLRARGWLGHALDTLLLWRERAGQRRQLLQLSDHMLRDLALTRADALGEAGKPFWRD